MPAPTGRRRSFLIGRMGSTPRVDSWLETEPQQLKQGCPPHPNCSFWKFQLGFQVGQYLLNRLEVAAAPKSTAEPLAKLIGPGRCGLSVCQQQPCRYNLTSGSKPICFSRLLGSILNAVEIALWQTRTTSKRAAVIRFLLQQTAASCPRHVAAEQKIQATVTQVYGVPGPIYSLLTQATVELGNRLG